MTGHADRGSEYGRLETICLLIRSISPTFGTNICICIFINIIHLRLPDQHVSEMPLLQPLHGRNIDGEMESAYCAEVENSVSATCSPRVTIAVYPQGDNA